MRKRRLTSDISKPEYEFRKTRKKYENYIKKKSFLKRYRSERDNEPYLDYGLTIILGILAMIGWAVVFFKV